MAQSLAELVQLQRDVYAFRYDNHVSLFIVSSEGVILVDPCGQQNPRTPSMLKEAVRAVTDLQVRYVLYSHSELDHSQGGDVFAHTATFVSTRRAAEKLASVGEPSTPLPTLTFDDHLTLELGDKTLELYASDLSATDDYMIVYFPDGRLLMWVDIVQPRNLPLRLHGSAEAALERIEWLCDTLEFDTFLTGHASPQMTGTKGDMLEQRHYYLDLSDAIEKAHRAGHPDRSIAMTLYVRGALQPRYGSWRRFSECLSSNISELIDWREGRAVVTH